MIYFFSGTGNSTYVAETMANMLGEQKSFIPFVDPQVEIFKGDKLGFVFPVYSWGIPPLVLDFIKRLPSNFWDVIKLNQIYVWVVMTCGDETALAPEMIIKELTDKGIKDFGIWSIIMPNNYVLLPGFDVDPKSLEKKKLEDVPARVIEIANGISSHQKCIDVTRGKWAWVKTRLVYPLFKRYGVNPRKWHHLENCISCGKCATVCPLNNIEMKERHPIWSANCCSCLACYHICPCHAVAYGKETLKKGQYFLKKVCD